MTFKGSTLKLRRVINIFLSTSCHQIRSERPYLQSKRFHGVRQPSGDAWTREETRRWTHTCFLDIIFIAISYWFGYRTGLHCLTWWNSHTSTSRGTHQGQRRDAQPQEVTKLAASDLPPHRKSHRGETGSRETGWDRGEGKCRRGRDFQTPKQEQRPRPHFPCWWQVHSQVLNVVIDTFS